MGFLNWDLLKRIPILGYIVSAILILLGALGIIDKNGPLEHGANEFISSTTGFPIEALERIEGVKSSE